MQYIFNTVKQTGHAVNALIQKHLPFTQLFAAKSFFVRVRRPVFGLRHTGDVRGNGSDFLSNCEKASSNSPCGCDRGTGHRANG